VQKDVSERINNHKRAIDELKAALDAKQAQRSADDKDVIDEEEFALVKSLKDAKKAYRDSYEELKVVKSETDYLTKVIDQSRAELVSNFETWSERVVLTLRDRFSEIQSREEAQPAGVGGDDVLDNGEMFERLEVERVMEKDPDSLAFHNATKNVRGRHAVQPRKGK
jgi:kinesin family member 6/9